MVLKPYYQNPVQSLDKMIQKGKFKEFLYSLFDSRSIYYEEFKENVHLADIDCFPNQPYKLTIRISDDIIEFSTISKEPEIDFSLYEYSHVTNEEAENFVLRVQKKGWPTN